MGWGFSYVLPVQQQFPKQGEALQFAQDYVINVPDKSDTRTFPPHRIGMLWQLNN